MTTTRPDDSARPSSAAANIRRGDQPLFAAKKRETKYFALSGGDPELQRGLQERDANPNDAKARNYEPETRDMVPHVRATSNEGQAPTSLKAAWERALREEEDERKAVGLGSPSPAARPRTANRLADQRRVDGIRSGRSLDLRRPSAIPRPQSVRDDTTEESGSFTGSLGEDGEEDELDRKISQFARDEERAKRLVQGRELFSRQAAGLREAETGQALQRTTSGSNENEPGVRIPAQWGRRARKSDNKWLQRIVSPDSSVEVDVPTRNTGGGPRGVDWAEAAANTPIPTIEGEGPGQQLTPPQSRPTSVQPRTASPERSQLWDADLDFTAGSVMESNSPQLRIRNSKIDDIRAREIEAMSKHAVANARLVEIRERLSEDRSVSPELLKATANENSRIPSSTVRKPAFQRKSAESFEVADKSAKSLEPGPAMERLFGEIQGTKSQPEQAPVDLPKVVKRDRRARSIEGPMVARKSPSPSQQEQQEHLHERTILEEEGEPIPGTPITIFRNADRASQEDDHEREDSYDTLRRLAAITRQSRVPKAINPEDKGADKAQKQTIPAPTESKRHSRSNSTQKSDVDPEERIAAEKDLFEIPDNKSERNSMREPSPLEDETAAEETPRPKPNPLSMPTPVVTGAYIETPATTRQSKIRPPSPKPETTREPAEKPKAGIKDFIRSSRSSSRSQTDTSRRSSRDEPSAPNPLVERLKPAPRPSHPRPPLINSAQPASAIADLMRIQRDAAIEDNTLDDFADLLAADTEGEIDANSTTILQHALDLEKDEKGRPLSAAERERRMQEVQLDKMKRGLNHGLESIRNAKRGIEKLEHQVSSSPVPPKATTHPRSASAEHYKCSMCASGSNVYHLAIPIPRLWFWDSSRLLRVRFTWFGLAVALWLAWYIAETITYDCIGKPEYSSDGNYDMYGPDWGWSLPRLADNWSGGAVVWSGEKLQMAALWVWEACVGKEPEVPWVPQVRTRKGVWSDGDFFEGDGSSMFEDETYW